MDGTGLGRSNASHREPALAFGAAQQSRGAFVWHLVEYCRGAVPRDYSELAIGISGGLDAAFVSPYLYAVEAEDTLVHVAGCFPGSDADSDRMGRSVRRHRPPCLVSFCNSVSMAVPAFPRDCHDVPRRLFARRVSDAACL